MKIHIAILCAVSLMCGCGEEKIENGEMTWFNGLGKQGSLTISTGRDMIETNVDSLEQASGILGQHGWEFVSANTDENGNEVYHMKRRAKDEGWFSLLPITDPVEKPTQ